MIRVKIEWAYPVVPNGTEIQISDQTGITFGGIRVLSQVLDEILISSRTTARERRPFD